ncbi:MAG: AAA family ATPase [Patescibacteria group bacterium]
MTPTVSLTGTRGDIAVAYRKAFFGPLALTLHVAVLGIFILGILSVEHEVAFIEAALLYIFSLGVAHRFLHEVLSADRVITAGDLREALDADLLSHVRKPSAATAFDLFTASIRSRHGAFALAELGIDPKSILETGHNALVTTDPRDLITAAEQARRTTSDACITGAHVLAALLSQNAGPFRDMLNRADLSTDDLTHVVRWGSLHEVSQKRSPWSPEGLKKSFGGMGRSWVMGYNKILDELTQDLTHQAEASADITTLLHSKETETLSAVLTRSANHNALLLGRKGSGRWTMVLSHAVHLRQRELQTGSPLTRLLLLKTQRLLSGTEHPDRDFLNALERRDKGCYVIVIRDLGLLLDGGDNRLLGVLMKLLESPNVSVIAIAEPEEYHKAIEKHPGVDTLLEKILLEEPSEEKMMQVLMEEYFTLERSSRVTVPYRALKAILEGTSRYLGSAAFPGKAIDVLREVAAQASSLKPAVVSEAMVLKAVSVRAHQDVSAVGASEREAYLHLEERLKRCIIGQDEGIHTLADALKRGKVQLGSRNRPIGTFLLLGPTGVGKTETAKAIAAIVFGACDHMIRLDMNEFSEASSVTQITGGTGDKGVLTRKIQERPSSLILLDELEKAHPHVLNLFLQILDEGHLIDSDGVKTDFRSSIILATSNAGSVSVQKIVSEHPDISAADFRKELIQAIVAAGTYSPEFLNRFDEVVVYRPLSLPDAVQVAAQMVGSIVSAMQNDKGITLTIAADALEAIATKGYSAEFGARAMRRAVQDTLETNLADRFLRQPPKRGEVITIARADLKI